MEFEFKSWLSVTKSPILSAAVNSQLLVFWKCFYSPFQIKGVFCCCCFVFLLFVCFVLFTEHSLLGWKLFSFTPLEYWSIGSCFQHWEIVVSLDVPLNVMCLCSLAVFKIYSLFFIINTFTLSNLFFVLIQHRSGEVSESVVTVFCYLWTILKQ